MKEKMKKTVKFGILNILALLAVSMVFSQTTNASELKHTYKKSETLWFLSQVYYGKGDQYQKIMQANGLKSPDGIEEGKVLVIKDYRFGEDAKFLAKRYQELSEKREKLLQNKKSEPSTVKPVEKSAKKKDPHTTLKTLDIEHPARSASQELGN